MTRAVAGYTNQIASPLLCLSLSVCTGPVRSSVSNICELPYLKWRRTFQHLISSFALVDCHSLKCAHLSSGNDKCHTFLSCVKQHIYTLSCVSCQVFAVHIPPPTDFDFDSPKSVFPVLMISTCTIPSPVLSVQVQWTCILSTSLPLITMLQCVSSIFCCSSSICCKVHLVRHTRINGQQYSAIIHLFVLVRLSIYLFVIATLVGFGVD